MASIRALDFDPFLHMNPGSPELENWLAVLRGHCSPRSSKLFSSATAVNMYAGIPCLRIESYALVDSLPQPVGRVAGFDFAKQADFGR